MVEISGIKETEGENCKEIALKICQTAKTDITVDKIEIAHCIVNGSIIVKFTDRPSRDKLYNNKIYMKNITTQDLGYEGPSSSVYIN